MTSESSSNPAAAPAETAVVLQAWVDAQFGFWERHPTQHPNPHDYFQRLNDSKEDVFVFLIRDGQVTLQPKPRHYTAEQMERGSNEHTKRAQQYRRFFADVVREQCPGLACELAMSMHDWPLESPSIPLFAFQKARGSHALLLPDIDSLIHNFYAGVFDDAVAYDRKVDKAIFIGSTTGSVHTGRSVQELSNERLKLGVFFRDHPDVIFNLPNITQHDSPETEQAIRALGFGTGGMSWQEQLNYKFLLSVDGNGATCSRVAIALKSHSVLLKFESPHVLYYFAGLEKHRHFIPIADPHEVQGIVEAEVRTPGLHRPIAEAGAAFYRQFLTPAPSRLYTALLLEGYAKLFSRNAARAAPAPNDPDTIASDRQPLRSDVRASCMAHVRDRGDMVFDFDSWIGDINGQAVIEGFQITFHAGIATGSLNCKTLTHRDGVWVQRTDDGFVGSRSRSNELIGLAFDLRGDAALKYDCVYVCAFTDGTFSPRCANGEHCLSDHTRPIKAFQITFPLKQ